MRRVAGAALAALRRHTAIAISAALIFALWAGVAYKGLADRAHAERAAEHAEQAYALMFDENVLRAIGEIDKTLLYMRRLIEGGNQAELFRNLATTHDLLSDIIVQVAVLDAHGIMRATNAGPQPPPATDLSDRPHFLAHLGGGDALYIGRPLVGRASKRTSVHFSRAVRAPDGGFGGVVVASLDPYHFAGFLDGASLRSNAAITLIGDDGYVRADSGPDDRITLGDSVAGTPIAAAMARGEDATFSTKGAGPARIVTLKRVRGQPLWVMVSMAEPDVLRDADASRLLDGAVAAALSLLVVAVSVRLSQAEARRRVAEAEVRRSALSDPLTDLPNRRVLRTTLAAALEAGAPCALLLLDLDRFKIVNDTLGHAAGDQLLTGMCRRLSAVLGPGQLLARLGGDEFAVVAPGIAGRPEASDLAGRLLLAAAEPFDIGPNRLAATLSIGVALGPRDGRDVDDLLVAADLALYSAKATMRGGHVHYDPAMREGLTQRHRLEVDLRGALAGGGLSLHFQPSISAASGRIASFEALARWTHPVHGSIPPNTFIAIAEETGLIDELGAWALLEACRAARSWPDGIRVAVNLSPIQLKAPDLVAVVAGALAQSGLPAARLEIEITEQTLLANSEENRQVLRALKQLGVSIAMDDFGTGYSSLNYLQAFPFDRVKVDRSFVAKLGQGSAHVALVRAVVDIARSFGMATTAEGVETAEQRDMLVALGCTDLQGFFYSKPLPPEGAVDLAMRWERAAAAA